MTRFGGFSGKDAVKRFEKVGYVVVRQKGSHVRMTNSKRLLHPQTVPLARELKIGLLHQLINDAGLDIDGFLEL